MDENPLGYLFERHLSGNITTAEKGELYRLLMEEQNEDLLKELMLKVWTASGNDVGISEGDAGVMLEEILQPNRKVVPFYRKTIFRIAAAAAVLGFIVGSYLLFENHQQADQAVSKNVGKIDIAPGRSGALLILAEGKKILLDTVANGSRLMLAGGVEVIKQNGEISYVGKGEETAFNTVSTDRGREWSLTLPDGTRVWLNASSTLHYPLKFADNERLVTLTGEAYFEVKHNTQQPFRVKVGSQLVEDIGTSFNINSYTDESLVKTTLLEGSVRVQSGETSRTLVPGQQAAVAHAGGNIHVSVMNDAQDAIAWKNGFFHFDHSDIVTVMRQLCRWYDVEVKYQDVNVATMSTFSGDIDRTLTLAEVLKILEITKAHFKIEDDKRVVIMP